MWSACDCQVELKRLDGGPSSGTQRTEEKPCAIVATATARGSKRGTIHYCIGVGKTLRGQRCETWID